ncbi:MAG: discoidin domain-containing protein [Clostridiaceae bacterium]|nr:discoidin domain-containing protein [Clostridiaceae bacterium]
MKKVLSFVVVVMILASFAVMPAMAEDTNLALGKSVIAESDYPGTNPSKEDLIFFSAAYLTDGENPIWDGVSQDVHLCWYAEAQTQDTDIKLTMDLGDVYALSKFVLSPSSFLDGQSFPSDFDILVSTDGNEWTKAGEVRDRSGAMSESMVFNTDKEARYVRIHITKMSPVHDAVFYYAGISEWEVYGGPVTAPETEPETEPNPGTNDQSFTWLVVAIAALVLASAAFVCMRNRKEADVF